MAESAPLIIGTAGHVDHGKTTLVKALTGCDTDRLPEEKRRGISIELGFAPFRLPGGREASIVDVPGHERFVHHMLAGAAGVDLALLVVAADEGVMPQTREHLDILVLLGAQAGVVAVTKVDLVEREWLELVRDEVRAAVAGTFLEGAPVVFVSAVTGEGLAELAAALEEAAARVRPREAAAPARLPVDRVFTMAGFGTVVTGTLHSGSVAPEDRLELLPARRPVRVRQVQVHGRPVARAVAGQRVALNLAGVERGEVRRGDVLAAPGSLEPSAVFAGRLRLLPSAPRPLRNEERVRVHAGTAEVAGLVLLLDREELAPGDSCYARVRLERPLALARGDRYVLRAPAPAGTLGGGVVLAPGRRIRRHDPAGLRELALLETGDPADLVAAALAAGPLSTGELAARCGLAPPAAARAAAALAAAGRAVLLGDGELVAGGDWYREAAARLRAHLAEYHRRFPLRAGQPREEVRAALGLRLDARTFAALLARLAAEGRVRLEQELVALPEHLPAPSPAQEEAAAALAAVYRRAGLAPPEAGEAAAAAGVGEEAEELLRFLLQRGELVKVAEGLYFHRAALEEAAGTVRAHLERRGSLTMAELRDLLGTTRKYAVPLGEYFDRIRLTRRVGDRRALA